MPEDSENSQAYTTEEVLALLSRLLCDYKPKFTDELEQACEQYPGLRDIVQIIANLRIITSSLSKGDLEENVPSQGYVVSNLKALQSNLHHLVWQMTQVSKGDFSQRIDFLGDFSESFNAMCKQLETQNLMLTEQARFDSLTKLANRQHLDEYLDGLFDSESPTGMDFALMMIDIDFFKQVNDTYGHDVGDIVLERTSEHLRQIFRTTDLVARYGGEEFAAVLPNATYKQAMSIAKRVLEHFVKNPIVVNEDLTIPVTVSIGVAMRDEDDESWDKVIKRSDVALYNAKNNGRNRVEFQAAKQ